MPPIEWDSFFVFTVSPLELFIRGTVVYLFVLILMRVLRREPGTIGIADLLMVVLIADASQNAMAGEYRSILDGLILVLTIVFWNFLIDWLTLRWPALERFTYPPPIPLVINRQMKPENMRKQFVTREQLLSILREHGVDDISKVKGAFIEGSGHVSVVPFEDDAEVQKPERSSRII